MTETFWMPPMEHILELEKRMGITGRDEPIVCLGDLGIVEHAIHELSHAALLGIVLDDQTRDLSEGVANEIAERGERRHSAAESAICEVEAMAVESLVIEALGIPIEIGALRDALDIQVHMVLDGDHIPQMANARETGHVAEAVSQVISVIAPNGRAPTRPRTFLCRLDREGFEISVYEMLLGNARLCISEPGADVMLNAWCYQTDESGDALAKAIRGGAQWDGQGDDPPGGWYRNPQSGRRRPGGDPKREFVHW